MSNEIIKERIMKNLRMNICDNFCEDGYTGLYDIYIENSSNYGLCISDKYTGDDISRSVNTKMLALYDAVRYEIPTNEYIETKVDVDLYDHTDILLIVGDTIVFRDGMNTWGFIWRTVEDLADYLFGVYTQICLQIDSELTLNEVQVFQPVFTCPNCQKNLFDVGVTECSKGATVKTLVDFKNNITIPHDTRVMNCQEEWVECNNCHAKMDIEIYQLNWVLDGTFAENVMKIRCNMVSKPIYNCPVCEKDIFKHGFTEVLYGGTSRSEITMRSGGYDMGDVDVVEFDEQWCECSSCDARIDRNAVDLINYYEGDASLEDME